MWLHLPGAVKPGIPLCYQKDTHTINFYCDFSSHGAEGDVEHIQLKSSVASYLRTYDSE